MSSTSVPVAPPVRTSVRSARPRYYSDILMVVGVAAIVVLMILPLPAAVIDALVAVNIAIGLALLLIALYIPTPVAFSSFPSVLLLTTLFRLSLGIATTRAILLDGHAGHIIQTFGRLGAGGNLVVGVVVFLIITIVQFIVIAKGAERVAEVAARFTLDALPGKQLSIDSDLRSGMLDKDEARRRRRHLEIESQLYGALDGAMKFVKGDAIAGIVIIVVNLLGGLAIGVLQRDMTVAQAVETYSILTIGDGLVSQIPALLASIAAGLVVTRTASEEQDRHLGDAVGRQFLAQPGVILITGVIAGLMTLVPGFPKFAFAFLGILLVATGLRMMPGTATRIWRTALRRPVPVPMPAEGRAVTIPLDELRTMSPLLVELGTDLAALVVSAPLEATMANVRERLYQSLGVMVPAIDIRVAPHLAAGHFRICLFEVPAASGVLSGESPEIALGLRLEAVLRRRSGQFIGIQEANVLAARLGREYPDLVKEVLRVLSLQKIAEVLRRLVAEQVPIRNLRDIFESLAEAGQHEKDAATLAEMSRIGLKRYLSEHHAGADGAMNVVLLHPEFEEHVRHSLRGAGPGAQVAMDPEHLRHMLAELGALRGSDDRAATPWVLLVPIEVRRPLRHLLETEGVDVPVLSYQELVPDMRVQPVGQVGVPRVPRPAPPAIDFDAQAAAPVEGDVRATPVGR